MTGDLLARIEADRQVARQAKAELREQFPFMAELTDGLRDAGLKPRPVYATNEKGETWGAPPRVEGMRIDGEKLAHLPEYEAAWRRILGKQPDNRQTYNQRAQRAIKPNAWRFEGP